MNPWQFWMLVNVTCCYAGTGIVYGIKGDWAWAVFWSSYALANLAYIVAMR